ncbi:MAG: hypothetical protein KY467_19025 [Gemmatimonadetes bacterium]|nr:hypothetical protein [Gemmatimonadota bacterium]
MLSPMQVALAVVSLDSSIPGFFSPEIQDVVLGCCRGVATYIVEAY